MCFILVSRIEHIKLHEKHKGHESMHAEMVVILLVTLIIAQVVLVEWKKRHYKSYSVISKIVLHRLPKDYKIAFFYSSS